MAEGNKWTRSRSHRKEQAGHHSYRVLLSMWDQVLCCTLLLKSRPLGVQNLWDHSAPPPLSVEKTQAPLGEKFFQSLGSTSLGPKEWRSASICQGSQ